MTTVLRIADAASVRQCVSEHQPFDLAVGNRWYSVDEAGVVYSFPYWHKGYRVMPKLVGRIEVLWPFLFREAVLEGQREKETHDTD